MQKISIIGSGGSGKTTLAIRLGSLLNIPVHHLDSLYWNPGWVGTEKSEWIAMQQALCKERHWIIDGNYGSTMDIRLNASDTVIFLDANRFVCVFNAVMRTVKHYGKSRIDMASGCEERFDFKFLQWIYGYPVKKKPEILKKFSVLEDNVTIHMLKNRKEIDQFLNDAQKALTNT